MSFGLSLLAVGALWLLGSTAAHGQLPTLRVCTDSVPFWPLMSPDPELPGDGQVLMHMAAKRAGIRLVEVIQPWRKCQQMAEDGSIDALNATSYAAINRAIAAFPMKAGKDDASRAQGVLRTYLFRRTGSQVQVRGGEFENLRTRVGIMNSYQLNNLSVALKGGVVDDNSRTIESLAQRLVSRELDLVGASGELLRQCAGRFAGQIEVLHEPLDEAPYYLAVSKAYYSAHPERVETLWTHMAKLRADPNYQAQLRAEHQRRNRTLGRDDCPLAQ